MKELLQSLPLQPDPSKNVTSDSSLMRSLVIASIVVANLVSGTPARAEEYPFWGVVTWYSMSFCSTKYGLLTAKQATDSMLSLAKEEFGMDARQVLNIMKSESFKKEADRYIEKQGGCRRIVEKMKERQQ
jgi:hypothetical protein